MADSPTSYDDLAHAVRVTLHEPDARLAHLPEAVVQDLWAQQRFARADLRTTDGRRVHVIDPGRLNTDGGADFSAAQVRIGETRWAGDVEIHRTSGDWLVHRHHEDPRYDRVILHVVLAADRHTGALRRSDGTPLPEIVLLPRLDASLRTHLWRTFARPPAPFACAGDWGTVPEAVRRPWLRRLGRDRLRAHADRLGDAFVQTADAEEALWRGVLRALGYAPNADAMERLARRVPLVRLCALPEAADREAVLLHAAGLLPPEARLPPGDAETVAYGRDLLDRAAERARDLAPLPETTWQFARLRPANQPARRIAQAAAMSGGWLRRDPLGDALARLDARRPWKALRELVASDEPDPFWTVHTRVETRCRPISAALGRERADRIVANALLPTLLLRAEMADDEPLAARVLAVLADAKAPSDRVTRRYAEAGAGPADALEAHGLHHLAPHYCDAGRCLACDVGQAILSRTAARP